ncbi:hypothetical protein [Streptosporangium sp. CA-115845]|uniref:hypothetical protein n=1 Tax=Streptosporangium sp. CA-115845 TaxID=3240071 RepID=UPI003D924F6B
MSNPGAVAAASPSKPYLTPYSAEVIDLPLVFERVAGVPWLTYTDALPQDRMFGVLWARCGIGRGGKILWPMVHTLRQRRCMLKRLCRVCGQSAADPGEPDRTWWIIPSPPPGGLPATWPATSPPTCKACIAVALGACPHLRHGSPVVCTVGAYGPVGVLGNLYGEDNGRAVETQHQIGIGLDEPHLFRRALATQLIVQLNDLRPADVLVS